MELSYQLASQSQGLGDLIIREILALNPDSLLGGKKTKAFDQFFLCFVFDELCLRNEANILPRLTNSKYPVRWLYVNALEILLLRRCQ